jgi:hypothetical protein
MLPNASLKWQLDMLRRERLGAHRVVSKMSRKLPEVARLKTIPGVGAIVAPTIVAWIAAQRPAFGWTRCASRA